MLDNPLKAPILSILKSYPQGISEYDIIKHLRNQQLIDGDKDRLPSDSLAMFRIHFMVMNALYSLKVELLESKIFLSISPLLVQLHYAGKTSSTELTDDAAEPALREYYLDWSHFDKADHETVDQLLHKFWERFLASDQRLDALETLGLEPQSNWQEIRRRYQQLIQKHHPDKGGSEQGFIAIRSAYETLESCCKGGSLS